MAPRSVARRVAESYLAELLEDEHLPPLGGVYSTPEGEGVIDLPTDEIVARILDVGAVKVERKRSKEHGEVIILTFSVEPPAN
jgi:hypothetical protein